ncbi:MAG: ABC transporter substrate-binding protein [Gammaproteobacteria bacterium]|nr:ABC transporter substrate-binding protein [Gammaproteobacteria bacterium]
MLSGVPPRARGVAALRVLVSVLVLAGCSRHAPDAGTTSGAASANAPAHANEVTVLVMTGSGGWPTGLDPATSTTGSANLNIMNAIFGGLFQLAADADGGNPRIIGVLAQGYEIRDDGATLVITLRDNLRFSDGTPLDAEALRFNIVRAIESPCACAPRRWPWLMPDPVRVLDAHSVALHFTKPYGAAINGVPVSNINWVVSPSALKRLGEEAFKLRPVGAGPFRISSNQLSTRVELERNPLYWQPERPYLDRLTFVAIGSEQSAYLALLAGDADVVESVTATPLIERALREPKVVVTRQPPVSPYLIQLNTARAPFNELRARAAIYHATDAAAIGKGLFHDWYPVGQSFTGPAGLFHLAVVPGYRTHDLERARALVTDLGGLKVRLGTVSSPVAEQVITALQSQWRAAGIDVVIETHDLAALVQRFQSRDWEAMLQMAGSYDPEAGSGVSLRFRSDLILSGVHDPDLDRLLYEGAGADDPQRRADSYRAIAQHLSDHAYAPFLFAFAPTTLSRKGLEGPGLTTRIPPILINTAVFWQDVRWRTR